MKQTEAAVLASSMEAYFDCDASEEYATAPDGHHRSSITVFNQALGRADILSRCFRFRYERTWSDYYSNDALSNIQRDAIAHHALDNPRSGAIRIRTVTWTMDPQISADERGNESYDFASRI